MYGQQMQQYGMPNNSIIWVQGIEGARAYQLYYPNSKVLLMDSEKDIFYLKSTDDFGKCSELKQYRYEEIKDEPKTTVDMSQYVTKSELEKLLNDMLGGKANE